LLPGGQDSAVVVAGDSAGGQLAASVAIAVRDSGWPLAAQLLLYPVTDLRGRYADPEFNALYPSRGEHRDGPGLMLAGMAFFAASYLAPDDADDWRASPIVAELAGVAPAIVHTAHLDVLRSEGNDLAERLMAAGVPVRHREFANLNHSYFGLGGVSAVADAAATQAADDLRELLGLAPR
jgi:acetyl esterase